MMLSFHLGNKRFLPEFIPLSGGRNDKRAGMNIAAQPLRAWLVIKYLNF